MFSKLKYESVDFVRRSLPFLIVAFSFVGLAYGYGQAMIPLSMGQKLHLMSSIGTFMP